MPFHRRVWPRVQPSGGEPLCELQGVRPLVSPNLSALDMRLGCTSH